MKSSDNKTIVSAIFGALAVALGAFGAHGLKSLVTPDLLETYRTGVFYHLTHSIVLFILSQSRNKFGSVIFALFCFGIVLFSFSLYFYVVTGLRFLVYFTPVGGIALIAGWLSVIITVINNKNLNSPNN